MKRYSIVSVLGASFNRCGMEFSNVPRVVTVGDGGDLSCEQFAWLQRAAGRPG